MADASLASYDAVFIQHDDGALTWYIGYTVTWTGFRFFDGIAFSRRGAERVARRFQRKILAARQEVERLRQLPEPEVAIYPVAGPRGIEVSDA